ncbi:hypothetical protein BK816_05500 [Boudabousia tangfeifanii]|uniref:NAD kinase n=1 Tax=Boudabousia tangfeifanii TaxID=1912795 RepID=A0A1D9MKH9_9ACTO|nr:NAD(+)/NADH kinase [Boudabousia tangfeifanii]AOZ72817.1 hypothetical protein BK816_05500 [Boudabousia tangfeifanii]
MLKSVILIPHVARTATRQALENATRILDELGVSYSVDPTQEQSFSPAPELVISLGGDGTFLAAAEKAREFDVPVIGFNTGHMGFLTEVGVTDFSQAITQLATGEFTTQARYCVELSVMRKDGQVSHHWALNEAAILRTSLQRPGNFTLGVNQHPVSQYAADGMLISTPTGSTAYAFSAGGPIMWPDVPALLVVPLAAHGLFTRPLVLGPESEVEVGLDPEQRTGIEMLLDSRRSVTLNASDQVSAKLACQPLKVATLSEVDFSSRLVSKFQLPVEGWRKN